LGHLATFVPLCQRIYENGPPSTRRQPLIHHEGVIENVYTRTSGTGLYLQVKISLDPLGPRSVTVSPTAFLAVGDHAGTDDEYYVAVRSGATSALREAERGGAVAILAVDYAPAFTSPDDVRLATSIAVHNALRKASRGEYPAL
jgi:hypothetical protein